MASPYLSILVFTGSALQGEPKGVSAFLCFDRIVVDRGRRQHPS
ncbi:hypothetical protein FOXYSP1_19291 [Fusarium oxysporum f. sp. phaseoli]